MGEDQRLGGDEEVTLAAGTTVLKIGGNRLADIDRERHASELPDVRHVLAGEGECRRSISPPRPCALIFVRAQR